MTRTSTVGTGLSLTTRTVTYSGSAPYNNPAWITGAFATPLQTSSYLVFTDVEFGKKITVKAHNGASLIPYGDLAFTKWNGNSTSGTSVNTTWNVEAGSSGLLLSGTPFGFSNPVVTLQSAQPISSLEYTIDMGSATNSLGFNFAVPVPEPATLGLAASAALGATMWLRRRR
ncbi:MAG: PEP-CTERM sorting domain-containing protein [Planctomycetaceae bacterium]